MTPIDLSRLRAFDTETRLFGPGRMAPRLICASTAELSDGKIRGRLIGSRRLTCATFKEYLDAGYTVAFTNAPYDLAVTAQDDVTLLAAIFKALREGRIYDVVIAETLNAIYCNYLGKNPDGSDLRKPSGAISKRYSLEILTMIHLGRADAKARDDWRLSYALLEDIPVERWPENARTYPIDDAENTFGISVSQLLGSPGRAPYQNLDNLPAQVEADFALKLGAAHSLRTDPERVEKLAADVGQKHARAVVRFQKKGWIRGDGTEDQAAVKRAIAVAYGATGRCPRCNGGVKCPRCHGTGSFVASCEECDGLGILIGKVLKVETVQCRGVKVKGRYTGCTLEKSCPCYGTGFVKKVGGPVTCKTSYDEDDNIIEEGCDGTGLDLDSAPMLPRVKNKEHPRRKGSVATERDALMESGDEDLSDYGQNEFEKSLTTYVPYLRKGIDAPLLYSPNVMVATGRCSVEGSPLHQMPRNGGERSCIRARGAWCGYPIEMVLGSTDYEAGELCTLSQLTYWLFGYSRMLETINASGKPGILHSDLAAFVLRMPLDEFLIRLKAKEKQAVEFRQAMKPINFGKPGGMGDATLVATNRKKNAGFTVCEGGPSLNEKGEPGYWGIRFCILTGEAKACGLEKVTEWRRNRCAPICKVCLQVVADILGPAYFERYPEIKDYFKWGQRELDRAARERRLALAPCAVWDSDLKMAKIIRERGLEPTEYSAFLNNGFQGMLADIGKDAFVRATRECYLGVKDDGSPSPLAGCRLPLYLHDEPLSELILQTAHLSGPRIAEIMVESGRRLAPDVTWRATTALAFWWSKAMEPEYDAMGKLIPWGPVPAELQQRFAA